LGGGTGRGLSERRKRNVLLALLIMFMAFSVGLIAVAIVIPIMGLAGAPGALLYAAGQRAQQTALRGLGLLVAALGQSFVVGVYAVLVVGLVRWFATGRPDMPTWPLWIAAFFQSGAAPTYAMKEKPEVPTAQHRTLGVVALTATIVFFLSALSPTALRSVYGWVPLFDQLASVSEARSAPAGAALQPTRDEIGRDECRDAIMSFIRAQAMMSDGAGNVLQLTASQEKEMLDLIRHGLGKATEVPDTFLESVHLRLRGEFRDHLVAGWQLYLAGVEERDPDKQIEGIRLVRRWDGFKQQHTDVLWETIVE
jgi:hypothetical protein